MEVDARVDEGAELLAYGERAVACEPDARSADLDDRIGGWIEPRGLQVERDELYVALGSSAATRREVRSSSHTAWHLSCTLGEHAQGGQHGRQRTGKAGLRTEGIQAAEL
jgi:hypothetical protein